MLYTGMDTTQEPLKCANLVKTKMETEVVSAAMLYFAGWSFGNDTNWSRNSYYTDVMNHMLILLIKLKWNCNGL